MSFPSAHVNVGNLQTRKYSREATRGVVLEEFRKS